MPTRDAIEKAGFVLGLAVLAFLYGYAVRGFGWFPDPVLDRAWDQARAVLPPASDRPRWTAARVYERDGARVVEPDAVQPGLTLVSSTWEDFGWNPGLRLLDRHGRTVHAWRVDPDELFPDSLASPGIGQQGIRYIHGSHLFSNGDVLLHVESRGTARLDACGEVRWRLPRGGHHSIDRADDGSFWISTRRHEAPPASRKRPDGFPGLDTPGFHDRLTRVSADGEVLEEFSVLDILYDSGLERLLFKVAVEDIDDVTHLNDIEPLSASVADEYPLFEAGDLLVSLKHLHLVLVFDPSSERVKWHASRPFIRQHDPDFTGRGWIGVFDNNVDGTERGSLLGGSRIVALQAHTDSTRVVFPTGRSDPFYTSAGGKWQELENGNLLLTEMDAGRVLEVAPDGRTVWEWIHRPYRETAVPEVFEGTRYGLSREEVASWPCSPVAPEGAS